MNSILEQLEINHTFLYQFVAFVTFYIILSQIYLKPFQRLIEKRQAKLKDDVESSGELLKSIDAKMADYQKALSQARTDARLHSEKVIADARTKEEQAIAALKEEIKRDYQKAAQQLQEDRRKVEAELQGQVEQMADQLVAKIKGA